MAKVIPIFWLTGLLVALSSQAQAGLQQSQYPLMGAASGTTTRYWDCCKPSCAWSGKAQVSKPVNTCNIQDLYFPNDNVPSACDGGLAYTCSNQAPWAINDGLAYGFAAAKLAGKGERDWCCACYKYVHYCDDLTFWRYLHRLYRLTFTSGAVAGKVMIVQVTNTGGDLRENQFDLAMPGGGVGQFNACSQQWGGNNLGNQHGGFTERWQCSTLPWQWQQACYWRFDWFRNADNPNVEFEEVACPQAMIDRTGCGRWS